MDSYFLMLLLGFLFLGLTLAFGATYVDVERLRAEEAEAKLVAAEVAQATAVEPSLLLGPVTPTETELMEYEQLLEHYLQEEQAVAARFVLEPSLKSLRASPAPAKTNGEGRELWLQS